jgi:RHS repeat-associated protein
VQNESRFGQAVRDRIKGPQKDRPEWHDEAYGKRTKETGTNEDKQRANSKDEDPTGLLNEGFRYRDLETGVWLSRDPAGFVDGPNLYAYVQQNPWSKFDPAGLFWSALVTAGFAAYDTYQYATGQMSGAEYARNMAVNGAALAADVLTAGQGGGLAVRAAALSCRAKTVIVAGCRAVEKADNIAATMESAAGAAEQMAKGNYGQAAAQIASAALTGKSSMSKMDVPSFCFMAGTRVQTHRGLEKIESLRVGGRVLADESAAVRPTAVRAGEWRRVEFTFADPHSREGKPCRVVLLRSAGHVAQRGWRAGAEVKIDFGEEVQRAEGRAQIVSITPAAAPEVGAGQVVTGTFQTWHRDLRELWMEGLKTPVRVTSGHRFYSASREAWVEAHHLQVGETVRTRDGAGCRVRAVLPLPGEHEVFNIEVETAHQYHVTTAGLLTHNNGGGNQCGPNSSSLHVAQGNAAAIQPFEVTTYSDFKKRSTKGDDLEGHEVLQHANLNERGLAGERLSTDASKGNIVIALPADIHKDVNKQQAKISPRTQTGDQNITDNVSILRQDNRIPPTAVNEAEKAARQHNDSL